MAKILLIEAAAEFRAVVKSILERDNHQVTAVQPDRMVAGGVPIEGDASGFDLVIVDIDRLSADHVEAIGRLERANPSAKLLALSAKPDLVAMHAVRVTMTIDRVFSVAGLLKTVQTVLTMP